MSCRNVAPDLPEVFGPGAGMSRKDMPSGKTMIIFRTRGNFLGPAGNGSHKWEQLKGYWTGENPGSMRFTLSKRLMSCRGGPSARARGQNQCPNPGPITMAEVITRIHLRQIPVYESKKPKRRKGRNLVRV